MAEVCDGWWLRERSKVDDCEVVKILERLPLELIPRTRQVWKDVYLGDGQSWS